MKAPADLIETLRGLTPEWLAARIDDLEAERKALVVLLRSVRAREREATRAREAKARGQRTANRGQ